MYAADGLNVDCAIVAAVSSFIFALNVVGSAAYVRAAMPVDGLMFTANQLAAVESMLDQLARDTTIGPAPSMYELSLIHC
ncbi:hypothetical protein D3C75_997210 [compost metagenome]